MVKHIFILEISYYGYYQNGCITTLHNLSRRPLLSWRASYYAFLQARPLGLILLVFELQAKLCLWILSELKQVPHLNQIVIGLDRASEDQFKEALLFFSDLLQSSKYYGMMAHD